MLMFLEQVKVDFRRFMRVGDFVVVGGQIRRIVSMTNVDMTLSAAVVSGTLDSYSQVLFKVLIIKIMDALIVYYVIVVLVLLKYLIAQVLLLIFLLLHYPRYTTLDTNGGENKELFFIKDKMQVTYTLKVRTKENDNSEIRSFVVNQGVF